MQSGHNVNGLKEKGQSPLHSSEVTWHQLDALWGQEGRRFKPAKSVPVYVNVNTVN